MITTTNIIRERKPVEESAKFDPDVVWVVETRNGALCEGLFFNTNDQAIAHASKGGRKFWIKKGE
jgi:hypothetical protein